MYTITLTACAAEARGRQKQATAIHQPEVPWPVSAYGRPTRDNLQRFVHEWERKSRARRAPLKVTRAAIIRRKGTPQGIVAVYAA